MVAVFGRAAPYARCAFTGPNVPSRSPGSPLSFSQKRKKSPVFGPTDSLTGLPQSALPCRHWQWFKSCKPHWNGSNRAAPVGAGNEPSLEYASQGGWVAARGRGPGKTIGAPGVGSSPCPTGLGFTLQTWPEGGPCTAKPSPQELSLHVCGFWEPVYKLASFWHRFRAFLGQMRSKCCK